MKLSIITINYNNAKGLERTIRSVISQTFTDYEYIVIDGGSNDGSIDIIKKYADNIDFWVSEPDNGIYNAMNKGTQQAHGEYCNYLNSGDTYSDKNSLYTIFHDSTDTDIITGRHEECCTYNIGKNGITMLTLYKWAIDHQATFIRRALCLKHPYDERYKIVSDWKFFIECLIFDNCSFSYIDKDVVNREMGGVSMIQSELLMQERRTILEDMLPPRILADYDYFAPADSPLLKLTPALNKTVGKQRLAYKFIELLLKIRPKR